MNSTKLFRRGGTAFFALAICVSVSTARAQTAPGAGGYNSEFGTDYRVGMAKRAAEKAPIFVVGMRVRTTNGAPQKWVAPRFAAALSEKLESVLGTSARQPQIGAALAKRGLRFDEIGGADLQSASRVLATQNVTTRNETTSQSASVKLRRALFDLERERAPRLASRGGMARRSATATTPSLQALAGDIALSGALENPATMITVSLHVARVSTPRNALLVGAPTVITLRAPSRDWAQLPARCVLALSDALPFSLSSPQRNALLRSASPFMPAASTARVRYETRVGAAIIEAQNAQLLFTNAQTSPAASRKTSLRNATALARRAQSSLRVLANAPSLPQSDREAAKEIASSARGWIAPLENIARAATPKEAISKPARR